MALSALGREAPKGVSIIDVCEVSGFFFPIRISRNSSELFCPQNMAIFQPCLRPQCGHHFWMIQPSSSIEERWSYSSFCLNTYYKQCDSDLKQVWLCGRFLPLLRLLSLPASCASIPPPAAPLLFNAQEAISIKVVLVWPIPPKPIHSQNRERKRKREGMTLPTFISFLFYSSAGKDNPIIGSGEKSSDHIRCADGLHVR